jgi:hypothetical protein
VDAVGFDDAAAKNGKGAAKPGAKPEAQKPKRP